MCLLSNDVYDYYIVSQGKTTIPNVDDGEECTLTDVSSALENRRLSCSDPMFVVDCAPQATGRFVALLDISSHTDRDTLDYSTVPPIVQG